WDAMATAVPGSDGRPLHLEVVGSDGVPRSLDVTPALAEQRDEFGEALPSVWQIGVSRGIDLVPIGFGGALVAALDRTWHDSTMIVQTVVRLFQGRVSARDLGGP